MPTFWLASLSKLLVAAMLVLLFFGGMVTSVGAGMSVPDWPTTFGHRMLELPFVYWIGPFYWEHTHRVLGMVVGTLGILLTALSWVWERRRWLCWLTTGTLLLIIIQGLMGGFRVTEDSIELAILHGIFAQICFCLSVWVAVAHFHHWNAPVASGLSAERIGTLKRWAWGLTLAIFVQLVLGAIMRHLGAGLAMPTFPFPLIPQIHSMEVDIHFSHRVGAVIVVIVGIIFLTKIFRSRSGERRLTIPAFFIGLLLALQFSLGVSIIWLARKPVPTTFHVITGAILLVLSFILSIRTSLFQKRLADPTKAFPPTNAL